MRLGKLLSVGEAADDVDVTPAQAEASAPAEKSPADTPEPVVAAQADH